MIPDYSKFREDLLSSNLNINSADVEIIKDIYENWEKVEWLAIDGTLAIGIDAVLLTMKSGYKFNYRLWYGLIVIFIAIGLILFFISWKAALATIFLGLICGPIANFVKLKEVKKIESLFISNIKNRDYKSGILSFTILYLSGAFQLITIKGTSSTPNKISSVL